MSRSYISSASALRQEPYVLETTVSGFSKKPIVSMKRKARTATRGTTVETSSVSEFLVVSCLPVCLGALRGRGFVEVRDFGVPDTAKSISWCGDNICLGIRKEYVILNTANGTLSEVFPSGRVSPPLVTSLPSGDLLLGKNIGVFVDQNGKLLQTERICWSEAPTAIVIQNPYAIALLPRRVEVRLLRSPYPLIQTVVLRHLQTELTENQTLRLTASGNFEEAIALCKLLPPEDSSLRAAKESSIHTRFAHYLFENGSYEEAMEHILASQVDITHKRRPGIIEKATSEGTEEVISDAVGKSMKSNKGRGVILPLNSGAREMAAILDTALLQALLHTGQSGAAVDLLKGVNYCDVKICEEILMKSKNYSALLELFKSNSMHHEALKILKQLLEDSKSNQSKTDVTELFSPELIIEYLKPLCRIDPMLVLESCPTQTIDLFLSGNISADLVNSYLKQHAPNMQGRYLELMMAMNETAVSGNLQNEMLLKRLPRDALYEERAVILGKMNQHELALSIYVHKFYAPDLALAYCDRIHESISYLPSGKPSSNIYLTLLQIYLNPKKSAKDFAKRIVALGSFKLGGVFVLMDET
uniref:CNH domain-containing protein n=1 Tax=Brassica campestris TaxID=3711 RepID=M4D265_BRACM